MVSVERKCIPTGLWKRADALQPVEVLDVCSLYIEVIDSEGYISRMPPSEFFDAFSPVAKA